MRPIFTTIGEEHHLLIIPDSEASADGHAVLTYTYSIYNDKFGGSGEYIEKKERKLHLEIKNDPDYLGYITFEQPGKIFSYTADGPEEITSDEVLELIEIINHYRDTPQLWMID
jgi:hypothetical protein